MIQYVEDHLRFWRDLEITAMRIPARGLVLIALGAAFVFIGLSQASAGVYRKRFEKRNTDGYVVAESRHGHGSIRGRVRASRLGPQVRLPGGTWLDCEISCSYTLRVNSIDFWENQGEENDGIGYLRYDWLR